MKAQARRLDFTDEVDLERTQVNVLLSIADSLLAITSQLERSKKDVHKSKL